MTVNMEKGMGNGRTGRREDEGNVNMPRASPSYPFTLPASNPDTKCFCANKNTV